jgi:hypothetical protein
MINTNACSRMQMRPYTSNTKSMIGGRRGNQLQDSLCTRGSQGARIEWTVAKDSHGVSLVSGGV